MNAITITEPNITNNKLHLATLPQNAQTDYGCRIKENVRGRGGGGALIFIHNAVPCEKGYDAITSEKNRIEHCSEPVFPKYKRRQIINTLGIHGPPKRRHLL